MTHQTAMQLRSAHAIGFLAKWRGVGIDDIDVNAKPNKRDKAIDTAVETILKNYPPKLER